MHRSTEKKNKNMKNQDVAKSYVAGRPAASSNLRTDGIKLWSYATVIGWTADDGSKIVSKKKWSPTTSQHQSLAIQAGATWEVNNRTSAPPHPRFGVPLSE